jgi:hypothetical protein
MKTESHKAVSMAGEPDMPFNEVNIKFTDKQKAISYRYGLTVKLTQADLPYTPDTKSSEKMDFVACADTIIIDSTLMNPGRNISLFARRVICKSGARIITTNLPPDIDWIGGQYPQQDDHSAGAPGANGVNGGDGNVAGNIAIRAQSIISDTPGTLKEVKFQSSELRDVMRDKTILKLATFKTSPVGIPDTTLQKVPFPFQQLTIPIDIPAKSISLTGLDALKVKVMCDPYSNISIIECTGALNVTCTICIKVGDMSVSGKLSGTFGLLVNQAYKIDISKYECTKDGDTRQETLQPALTIDWQADDLTKMILQPITADIAARIGEKLVPYMNSYLLQPLKNIFENVSLGLKADLVVLAKGGRGGQGQDGHMGIQGSAGSGGQMRTLDRLAANGGQGSQGGRGGDAGKAGTGGKGGKVDIRVIGGAALVYYNAEGGDGGPRGVGNKGGSGGIGGAAGIWLRKNPNPSGMPIFFEEPGSEGVQGPSGPQASFMGNLGLQGTDNTANTDPARYKDLAMGARAEQLLITQRAAQFAYINATKPEDYEYPVSLANWLNNISSAILEKDFIAEQWDDNTKPIARSIRDFSATMLGNFMRGLDFYGHYRNWTPVLSLDSYQKRIDQVLVLGKIIEDQYNRYQDDSIKTAERLAAIGAVKDKLVAEMARENAEIADLQDQIGRLDSMVAELDNTLQVQYKLVAKAEDLFTKEFRKYSQDQTGCDFMKILEVITTIVSVGAGAIGKIKGIKDAYDKFAGAKDAFDKVKTAIKILEEAQATIESLKKGYDKISKVIDPSKKDVGLLVTEKAKFDKMIEDYLDKFGAAQTLKDAVDQLFNIINTRNEAICAYTSHFITVAGLQAERDQKKALVDQVAALMRSQQGDPALPAYTAFMQNSYSNLKLALVRKLYEESRAYEYWSLEKDDFNTSNNNIATLANTHLELSLKIDKYKVRKGGPFQPLNQTVVINTADFDVAFKAFATTKKFTFTLKMDLIDFKTYYQVMVSKVRIELPDVVRTKGVFDILLIHSGVAWQLAAKGAEPQQYSHLPRKVPYRIDFANPKNTGGGLIGDNETQGGKQGYPGLSPFTTWTLDFSQLTDEEFKGLEKMKTINLTFEGTYIIAQRKKRIEKAKLIT